MDVRILDRPDPDRKFVCLLPAGDAPVASIFIFKELQLPQTRQQQNVPPEERVTGTRTPTGRKVTLLQGAHIASMNSSPCGSVLVSLGLKSGSPTGVRLAPVGLVTGGNASHKPKSPQACLRLQTWNCRTKDHFKKGRVPAKFENNTTKTVHDMKRSSPSKLPNMLRHVSSWRGSLASLWNTEHSSPQKTPNQFASSLVFAFRSHLQHKIEESLTNKS